jgi:hypothetical protein
MVRVPPSKLNKTVDNGASHLSYGMQFFVSILRLVRSCRTNLNISFVVNVLSSSHFSPSNDRTVQLLDALPPRCQRPCFDLERELTSISGTI